MLLEDTMNKIILIIIGLLMSAIDINIPTGFDYPIYQYNDHLGKTFQSYVIQNIVGSNLVIDLLPDIIGFILIFIGVTRLLERKRTFIKAFPFLAVTLAFSILRPFLPMLYHGTALTYGALIITFFGMIAEIFMEFIIINNIVSITNAVQNKRNNIAVKVGWILSITCKIIIFFTGFVGLDYLTNFYGSLYILSTVFYCIKLYFSREYITNIE
jgi:hypothetical protein